jgi:hypothetical protein
VRKARGFGGWGVSSGYWDFVFSEKEPVRLDGRGAGALPARVRVWRFGCSSELVLLCERVLFFPASVGKGDMNTMLREGLDEGLAEASSAIS